MKMLKAALFWVWVLVLGTFTSASVTPQLLSTSSVVSDDSTVTEELGVTLTTPLNSLEEEDDEDEEESSTSKPEVFTTLRPSSSTQAPEPENVCPHISNRPDARSLQKCQCQGNEILVDGECQDYPKGTLIPIQSNYILTKAVNVTNYKVVIKDVMCDPERDRFMTFSKNQFHLRQRGDMVLLEKAGELHGQRINKYCVQHHLDDHGDLTWTMKACVPLPAIPRCCPPGQAMKAGSCQPARTPEFLNPPIGAMPFSNGVDWPNITNYISPLTCTTDPMKTIPILYKGSNLVSLANGVANGWIPDPEVYRRVYHFCPNYCVDGIQKSDGSVDYYTSFCYSNAQDMHKKICGDGPCIRKCCKFGEAIDNNQHSCVTDPKPKFNPHTSNNISHYNIAIGWPLCTPSSKPSGLVSVDKDGYLRHNGRSFPATDYCVDTFYDNDVSEQSALACLAITSVWQEVRRTLFPICNAISILFLSVTIICHYLVPKLLKNGGVHQLCHALALFIAYFSSFCVNVFHDYLTKISCFSIAIILQVGFLTTFFWLSVMCFEIWRKIRRLKLFRQTTSYPTWYFMLYAWGIPCLISTITVMMEYLPGVPSVLKPNIGYSRCWFYEDWPLLLYFYGPIAFLFICNTVFLGLTFYNYKMMMANYKKNNKELRQMGTVSTTTLPRSTSRQITDHVQEFKQKFCLFVLMATCWVAEVLSWKIPPLELWALTDTLNSLQGFFIFIILLSNRNKRKQLEEQCPLPFKILQKILNMPSEVKKFVGNNSFSVSPMNSLASAISKKLSNSTTMTNLKSSLKSSSTSSFSIDNPSVKSKRSQSLDETESGIVTLSHSPLYNSKSYGGSPTSTSTSN